MSREAPAEEDILAPEELSEILAGVEGTTAETVERGAEELDLAPPGEATVVGYSDRDPLTEPDDG